jgi:uncharacterized membrane protein YoaK (UPF0700 family)
MPRAHTPVTNTAKAGVALLLTFVAGYVDVVGYLAFFHVFTANMTGNTVHLALQLLGRKLEYARLAAAVLAAFMVGSIAGRTIIEAGARNRVRRIASTTLLMEAALIGIVAALRPGQKANAEGMWLLAMLAVAMGIQTATLTRIGPLTIHTTFLTGMMNKLAQLLSHGLFLTFDLLRGRQQVRGEWRQEMRRSAYFLSIWLLYFAGALVGARTEWWLGLRSLVLPAAALGCAVILDQLHPLSLQEEQDEE